MLVFVMVVTSLDMMTNDGVWINPMNTCGVLVFLVVVSSILVFIRFEDSLSSTEDYPLVQP